MKKLVILALAVSAAAIPAFAQSTGRLLYLYDEVNEQSEPYIAYFEDAFARAGLDYDAASAAQAASLDLSRYDRIVVHGMVMAFNSKSPIRDWLRKKPDLRGKRVYLLVTANRWFLDRLYGQLVELLQADRADQVDAVSMATKDMDATSEAAAVRERVDKAAQGE